MDAYAGKLRTDIQILKEHKYKAEKEGNYALADTFKKEITTIYNDYKKIPKWNRVMSKIKYRKS